MPYRWRCSPPPRYSQWIDPPDGRMHTKWRMDDRQALKNSKVVALLRDVFRDYRRRFWYLSLAGGMGLFLAGSIGWKTGAISPVAALSLAVLGSFLLGLGTGAVHGLIVHVIGHMRRHPEWMATLLCDPYANGYIDHILGQAADRIGPVSPWTKMEAKRRLLAWFAECGAKTPDEIGDQESLEDVAGRFLREAAAGQALGDRNGTGS